MNKNHYVYIASDNDEYEFPFAVADTIGDLAEQIGVTIGTVKRYLAKGCNGDAQNHTYKIEKVRMSSEREDIRDLKVADLEEEIYEEQLLF